MPVAFDSSESNYGQTEDGFVLFMKVIVCNLSAILLVNKYRSSSLENTRHPIYLLQSETCREFVLKTDFNEETVTWEWITVPTYRDEMKCCV